MRIASASVSNFGSYKTLAFDFTAQGLVLIQGANGSGKSTLCDIIPWGLFGRTAKGGSVDEVVSWPGDEVTKVTLYLDNVTISRSRGLKAKDNDLMFWPVDGVVTRGKDLNDTQKMINNLLQIDIDLYLAGAYFHEFSQTAQFFTTTAKNRRAMCEQIVDLSLAKKLQLKVIEDMKETSKFEQEFKNKIDKLESNIILLNKIQNDENNRAEAWEQAQIKTKEYIVSLYDKFEKNRLKTIHNKCNECGTQLAEPKEIVDKSENPHLSKLAELETAVNPYTDSVKDYSNEMDAKRQQIIGYKHELEFYQTQISDLELLQDVVAAYRSATIQNTIQGIEYQTNQLLMDHFDSECKVSFTAESADKLDIIIYKDDNKASYTQLSKGQRQLLKLCFGVSIMQAVSNQAGVNFKQVFFDEATDGLDTEMKLKAYGLLETLSQEYETIFLVEHSETLKSMANNSYKVTLVNGESQIASTT